MHRLQAPRTWVALALSLVVLVLAIGVTLSRSPPTVARSNLVNTPTQFQTVVERPFEACQGGETLPAHVTAIRLSLDTVLGPAIKVKVRRGKRVLTTGERGTGWTAADVTVPVKPLARGARGVSVCFAFVAKYESVNLTGERAASGGAGRIKIEYLRPGEEAWWSRVSAIADHMAFGHAWSGAWLAPALALAMAAIVAAVAWSAIRFVR
jgi:hypothetical protein